jgi:transposase
LPAHLPRIEVVVDIDDKTCPCCKGSLHRIGEDVSERLDILPARFRVLATRRPKYACRSCEEVVVQAPAPARLIAGGIPTEATVGHVLVSKYADHLPLYRQEQIFARLVANLSVRAVAKAVGSHHGSVVRRKQRLCRLIRAAILQNRENARTTRGAGAEIKSLSGPRAHQEIIHGHHQV